MSTLNCSDEHLFVLSCDLKGDFHSQVRRIFSSEDPQQIMSLAEGVEVLCNSLERVAANPNPLLGLDDKTLNYSFRPEFLDRYRSTNSYLLTCNYNKFEDICALCAGIMGCEDFFVTRQSNDQGLDFYGGLPFDSRHVLGLNTNRGLVIGQAKFYTDKIGTSHLREFHGSIDMVKQGIASDEKAVYGISREILPYTNISPVFITSSTFTVGALSLAQRIGIRTIERSKLIGLLTSIDEIFSIDNTMDNSKLEFKLKRVPRIR